MIRTFRIFFLGRLLREKLLLLAFVAIGMLWWLSSYSTRVGRFFRETRAASVQLKDQQLWLDNRNAIDAAVQKAAAQLDPAKTLDGLRLTTEVSNLAAAAGFRNNFSADPTSKTTNGQFSVHTLNCTVRNADYMALQRFYVSLRDRSPYIAIDQFTLISNPANPTQLSLNLRVSSVEISR